MAKKTKKKVARKVKRSSTPKTKHELVVRVETHNLPAVVPTVTDLSEPMTEGKKMTLQKTWLSENQLHKMLQQTPPNAVYTRPGKGGNKFRYVTGKYMERVLNFAFAWNWDFHVVQHGREGDFVWVLGRLTVRGTREGQQIVKEQFGRADIKYTDRKSGKMLDFGNDLKSAATDSFKKCSSLLGIASDIYGTAEYKEETGKEPRYSDEGNDAPPPEKKADGPVEELYCHGVGKGGCPEGAEITRAGRDYSVKLYGKPLCRECVKKATPLNKK